MAKMIAGKLLYGLVCLLAAVLLVVSGYAHKVAGLTTTLEKGVAIPGSTTVGTAVDPMNILVMGLESRTNYQGQTLPNDLLTAGEQVIGARAAASQPPNPAPSSTTGAGTSATGTSGTGGTVTVPPNAPYGIPCAY